MKDEKEETAVKSESVRKLLEIEWQDHFHMRDQTWRTLQIEAALVLGLVGADLKFASVWVTTIIGFLIILSTLSGFMITLHHRKNQNFKFENIIRFETWLGLIEPGLLEGVKPPKPFSWSDLIHPKHMNTSLFIMRMHIAMGLFTAVYVTARILSPVFPA